MKKSFSTKVRSAAIAAVTVLGLGLGAAGAAAQPSLPPLPAMPAIPAIPGIPNINPATGTGAKQVVTFGDSFTANAGKSGPRGLEEGQTPIVANCATDMENWPKIAAHQAGKSLGDWSCNGMGGAPVVQLVGYVEAAIMHGDIAPGTQDVVFMYGGMDALQWVDVAGEMQIGAPEPTRTSRSRHAANRIREVAPGVQIHLASPRSTHRPAVFGQLRARPSRSRPRAARRSRRRSATPSPTPRTTSARTSSTCTRPPSATAPATRMTTSASSPVSRIRPWAR